MFLINKFYVIPIALPHCKTIGSDFKGAVSEFGKSPSLMKLLVKWLVLLFS